MKTLGTLSAVFGLIFLLDKCGAYRSYNEVCRNNVVQPTDPQNCDHSAYLECVNVRGNGLCQCQRSLVWQEELGKCTFSLQGVCTGAFGGPNWPVNPGGEHGGNGEAPGCPNHSYCDTGSRGSGRCECIEGHEANEELTECSGAASFQNLITLTLTLLPTYFIAIKMIL